MKQEYPENFIKVSTKLGSIPVRAFYAGHIYQTSLGMVNYGSCGGIYFYPYLFLGEIGQTYHQDTKEEPDFMEELNRIKPADSMGYNSKADDMEGTDYGDKLLYSRMDQECTDMVKTPYDHEKSIKVGDKKYYQDFVGRVIGYVEGEQWGKSSLTLMVLSLQNILEN